MNNDILTKLHIIESLQSQELKIYEKFLITLEQNVRELLPEINQPELLNEMMVSKNKMMQEIQNVEEELSPMRKEVAGLSSSGNLAGIDKPTLDKIKNTDLTIIDVISRISRSEQELTTKIKNQMERIKLRLNEIGHERGLQKKYKVKKVLKFFNQNSEETPRSSFDSVG
ncbi:MAG: hypothetical protein A2Y40_08205 [Candidatus Margulisbacteria bacterium GWF2_35_9]|nr:MAG: hypothetical protein A2Y40_08205 [Candidatus Margulisbacteria bacterium GWF2_35_9]